MKLVAPWLNEPGAQAICARLSESGHQALFVGGCVRNTLMGLAVSDVDLATDAHPDVVCATLEAAGMRVVPTGIAHGTLTIVTDGRAYEITTFRRDLETDGRRACVAFSKRLEDDAARRDFTMNALYAHPDGALLDPLEAYADVVARRLRFVGDPVARIREDYLRILRFFRFYAAYADPSQGPDPDALSAIATQLDGLERLSRERIGVEMRKLLSATDPAPALSLMAQTGVLSHILPGADPGAIAPLVHLEAGLPPDWLRRLAVLGGADAATALRLSRQQASALSRLRAAVGLSPLEAGYRLGARQGQSAVLGSAALMGSALADTWHADVDRGADATFPINAADLPSNLQGPAIGSALRELEARWIDSGFKLTREDLLAYR